MVGKMDDEEYLEFCFNRLIEELKRLNIIFSFMEKELGLIMLMETLQEFKRN